ncbi:glycosyltransferase, partial [Candidatus Gottesmanbacteria bacterium]|nr:glycosyltransferase [Candidatus Gottesmanbacteria bacterium]
MSLSIVMVTRNVEDVIEETLKSAVGLWDELLVDDSGSSDDTVDIVRQFGGR